MKKIFTLFLLLALGSSFELSAQAKRHVMVERFTNASCGPCAIYGPAFNDLIAANAPNMVMLAYQCNFPGVDPMNAQNPTDVAARYNAAYPAVPSQGIPYCALDGNKYNGHIANLTQATISARLPVTSPIELTVDHNLSAKLDSMVIDITLKNVSSAAIVSNSVVLYVAMIEKVIRFGAPPGTNGETQFGNVMRKMYPSAAGTTIALEIAAGETKTYQYRVAVPAYIYDLTQLGVISFVQKKVANGVAGEMVQAAESFPKPLTGNFYDLTGSFSADTRVGYCSNLTNYSVDIKNLSTATDHITKVVFTPLINGLRKTKQSWTGDLAPGATTTFKLANLNIGTTGNLYKVVWQIDTVYSTGGKVKEVSVSNNYSDEYKYILIPAALNGTELNANFELPLSTAQPPKTYFINEGIRLFKVDSAWGNNGTADFPNAMGGFGRSRYSACFYFFDSGVEGKSSSIYFDKFNLAASKNTTATWNYAYSTKDPSNTDQLEINVSKDCGATWTNIYTNSGDNMATCVPDPGADWIAGYWFPYADQWKAETVDLKAFDGTPELLVQVKGTGGGGNGLWFDDFSIKAGTTGTKDAGIISNVTVFPNPAHDLITVQAELTEASVGSVYISDLSGKVVLNLNSKLALRAGLNDLSFPINLETGLYQLEIRTAKGVSVQKISIF